MKKFLAWLFTVPVVLFLIQAGLAFSHRGPGTAKVSFKPLDLPIQFSIDSDLHVSVSYSSDELVTFLGKLSVESSQAHALKPSEYMVAFVGEGREADTFVVRSDKPKELTVRGADEVHIVFQKNRATLTAPRSGSVVMHEPGNPPPAQKQAPSPRNQSGCPNEPGPALAAHEWTDGTVRMMICLAANPMRLFYYGYNQNLADRNLDADILLDATQDGDRYTATNGDTTYAIDGSTLRVFLPNKTLTYSTSMIY
jgi:hypothetical protein